ncbi:hypothetical protein OS493_006491 [Desmophyllum pertusum]|uniref:Uncharacterized protein n=1 Tax=Desmophyllum pertusum TaxID=174260 RepID=A0A9X0DAL5_9CNID|nr:hypothetical protein OS493_006491 [Desmophyllum pertusum]
MKSFDVEINPSLQMNSIKVADIPDLTEMTMCMWLKIGSAWDDTGNKLMYLVAYDVDHSDQMTTNSFFAGLNDDKQLVFGIGNSAPPCNFDASDLMDSVWHHICLVWDGSANSGYTSYYKDGNQVKFQECPHGRRTGGSELQLGGGGRAESVEMTGFYLWNRMLREFEIADEAKECDTGTGGPVVRWRDFFNSVRKDQSLRTFVTTISRCYFGIQLFRETLSVKSARDNPER